MNFFYRVIDWLFRDGKLNDDDVERLFFCFLFVLGISFILCTLTTVASYWYSVLIPSCP